MALAPARRAELAEWLDTPGQIRAWREEARLTQTEAAALIGVNVRTYIQWELGRRSPRPPRDRLAHRVFNRWRQAAELRTADQAGHDPVT